MTSMTGFWPVAGAEGQLAGASRSQLVSGGRAQPSSVDPELVLTFPSLYGGAFDASGDAGADPGITRDRFGQEARAMLARQCGDDVASMLVGVIERMAAAVGGT